MTRFVIDAPTLLHLVREQAPVADDHQLVAPNAVRTQALDLLLGEVLACRLTDAQAMELHDRMTQLRIRLLGDRVSRRVAWQLAREHGLDTVADAEHLAVTRLQADAYVTVDDAARTRAEGIVPLGTVDQLAD